MNNTSNRTKRVMILAKYSNSEDMFITNLEYKVFNRVFKSNLTKLVKLI